MMLNIFLYIFGAISMISGVFAMVKLMPFIKHSLFGGVLLRLSGQEATKADLIIGILVILTGWIMIPVTLYFAHNIPSGWILEFFPTAIVLVINLCVISFINHYRIKPE
jgi:hypothetical protein